MITSRNWSVAVIVLPNLNLSSSTLDYKFPILFSETNSTHIFEFNLDEIIKLLRYLNLISIGCLIVSRAASLFAQPARPSNGQLPREVAMKLHFTETPKST